MCVNKSNYKRVKYKFNSQQDEADYCPYFFFFSSKAEDS
jgi:hypothetical protein